MTPQRGSVPRTMFGAHFLDRQACNTPAPLPEWALLLCASAATACALAIAFLRIVAGIWSET